MSGEASKMRSRWASLPGNQMSSWSDSTMSSPSQAAIARFLARLSTLSALDNVRLTESNRVDPQANPAVSPADAGKTPTATKQKVVVTFTVTADLHQGATS